MSSLTIRLLGRPQIERDGVVAAPPRGHKAWAVLAYLVLAERPTARAQLASLIFADADDPLGALRWTLAQLRRSLGVTDALRGDPLEPGLPADATVDVLALAGGDPALARGELLEGIDPRAGAVFEAWLLVERRRLAGVAEGVLRDAALSALAAGAALEGAALATRALAYDPFDESAHELLVRCLARAGDGEAARRHCDTTEELFRRELGRAPDPRVRRAAGERPAAREGAAPPARAAASSDDGSAVARLGDNGSAVAPADENGWAGDRAAARGQLDAGRAALDAGAVEPGVACLRQACAEARGVGDPALLARTQAALGVALVHAVRGHDEEGAAVLHEALVLAERSGDRAVAAKVCRELGFVEVLAGRGVSAGRWLLRAGRLAVDDPERAAVLGVRGLALADRAHYQAAIGLLTESVATARRCGDHRRAAWSLAMLGRCHLLRDEPADAVEALDESLRLVEREGWVALQPLPEALRAEVALRQDELDRAAALLDHAYALGCRLGDPCWEAFAARAQGLLHEALGERAAALASLRNAVDRAVRVADPYVWVHAYSLDALAAVAIADGAPDARKRVATLERVAARAGMRELVVRGALHRARLGDPTGVASAGLLAESIDNPALHAELTAVV